MSYYFGYAESGFGLTIGRVFSEEDETFFFADEATGDFYWSNSASGGLMMPSNVGIGGIVKKIIEIFDQNETETARKAETANSSEKRSPQGLGRLGGTVTQTASARWKGLPAG